MKVWMNKWVLFLLQLTIVTLLKAQVPSEEFASLSEKYPDENDVTTNKWSKLFIEVQGDSLQIIQEEYDEVIILKNPLQNSKGRVYTSSFSEVFELEAYTLIPGKKKYKKVEVEEYKKSYDKESFVFYDDSQWINFNFPQIAEGAKVVRHIKRKIKDPHIIGQFFFASSSPILRAKYEIVAGNGVVINTGIYNEELLNIKKDKIQTPESGERWIFSAENIGTIDYEDDSPNITYLSSSVYSTLASYQTDSGQTIKVLSSLDDLYDWYSGFVSELEIEDEVARLASEIVEQSDSDLEKVRKIFYWVQENVKYIAFEQGMRGFIPHSPDYVMNKRYGDCKDMSSLLVGLIRSVGLDANYTWIGSRNLPYSYHQIPSPIVDDHMIASVEIEGQRIFLDATGNYTPIGYPTSMIQGKECLIKKSDGYEIVKVPVIAKEENLMVDTSLVWVENGHLYGKGRTHLTGLAKVANTYKMIQKNQKREENYLRLLLSRGSNKFFLDSHEVFNLDDLDKPIEVEHEFRVVDYPNELGDQLYINLCLDKSLVNDLIKDRKIPKENDYKYTNRSVVYFEIPDGYEVSETPEDSAGDFDVFGYSISYVRNGSRLTMVKEFYVDYLLLQPDQFDYWNRGIKAYSKSTRNAVVLTKK